MRCYTQVLRCAAAAALFLTLALSPLKAFEPLGADDAAQIEMKLIPLPSQVSLGAGTVKLDEALHVELLCPESDKARQLFEKTFTQWFGHCPKIESLNTYQTAAEAVPDGYKITAEGETLRVEAPGCSGILNALKTLRQIAEPNRDALKLSCYLVPELAITDSPTLSFRGLHLCWFPETDPIRIEQAIRLAGYYKFNYVVIEPWGTFRFQKHPEFCWSDYAVDRQEIRRLVEAARSMGVTLIPQMNLFGHASQSRGSTGKHVPQDFHPEFQPLFEPDGWTWCLSNPATRELLTDLVLELYEAFDSPPYFHIGCDEAYSARTCRLCRAADYHALLLDHLTYFCQLMAERDCRTMMWHDMLISRSDFPGYVANGNDWSTSLIDDLPKGMIICDWQYGAPKENETWPTADYFADHKFDVILCPWTERTRIDSLGKKAASAGLMGILETTWHHFDGESMRTMLASGAGAAWGSGRKGPIRSAYTEYQVDFHLRQIGWDMQNLGYEQTGTYPYQLTPRPAGPR